MIFMLISLGVAVLLTAAYHLNFCRTYSAEERPGKNDPTYWPLIASFSLVLGMVAAEAMTSWPGSWRPWMLAGWALVVGA